MKNTLKGYASNYEGYDSFLTGLLDENKITAERLHEMGYKTHDGVVYKGERGFS